MNKGLTQYHVSELQEFEELQFDNKTSLVENFGMTKNKVVTTLNNPINTIPNKVNLVND